MTSAPVPVLRSMFVCEEIITDPKNENRVSLVNVLGSIRSKGRPDYPLCFPQICVFAQISECRGKCVIGIQVRAADTDSVVFETRKRTVQFSNNPLLLRGLRWWIRNCNFPAPGLYWVQLWVNDHMLAQQPLVLR